MGVCGLDLEPSGRVEKLVQGLEEEVVVEEKVDNVGRGNDHAVEKENVEELGNENDHLGDEHPVEGTENIAEVQNERMSASAAVGEQELDEPMENVAEFAGDRTASSVRGDSELVIPELDNPEAEGGKEDLR